MTTVFCRDCKHMIPSPISAKFSTCNLYPREPDSDYLVTGEGENKTIYQYCTIIRLSNAPDNCGPSGKRFELRISEFA